MATSKKAPAARKTTAIIPWEQAMAAAAQKQAAAEKPVGIFKQLSVRGGILSVDDTPVKGNELRCILLVGLPENQYYTGRYDPNTPQVPSCYAFGDPKSEDPEEGMAPHENAKDPQAKSCADCEHNVMGSSETGRGKACKNVRRVVLITEDSLESPESMEEAETRMLKVPVTSVKNWSKYVHKLSEEMQRPSWGVITKISAVQDPKTQFKVLFSFEELIQFNQKMYDAMQKKITEVSGEIAAPYPDLVEEVKAPPRGRATAAKKPAAKRKY